MNSFIKIDEVKASTKLSKSSIYQKIAEGNFPAPIKLGARSVVWVSGEIQEWIASKIAASRTNKGAL